MQSVEMSETGDVEETQISYDQFCSDCQHIVKTSEALGDKWRLAGRDGSLWLECEEHRTVTDSDDSDDRQGEYSSSKWNDY